MSGEATKKLVVAGGSGFIGGALLKEAKERGYETVVLSRSDKPVKNADRVAKWDGKSQGAWTAELEDAQAVVNLSGVSLMGRQTDAYKKKIVDSRVEPTQAIAEAIAAAKNPPKAWINASAVGFYGYTGNHLVCEATGSGEDWLSEVCREWEAPVEEAELPDTRKVRIRFGMVMGKGGGAFDELLKATKFFVGGAFGSGEQYMSWIHIHDLVRMILWAAERGDIHGVLNGTAPKPVPNAEFMAAMREAVGRPPVPPLPDPGVKLIAGIKGIDPNMLLRGTRAIPLIAESKGFEWQHADLHHALDELVDNVPASWRS